MTVWRYAVSWSKFTLALECPRKLQYTIDKKPAPGHQDNTFYMDLGTLVQYIFELYFNHGINMKAGGQDPEVIKKIAYKVLASKKFTELNTVYPHNLSEAELKERVLEHSLKGFEIMKGMGMTTERFRSEVKWNAVFRGFRMFCMIDFVREGRGNVHLYDGKGHGKKNADPRQVLYYALAVAASGKKVTKAGLIYWQHDFEPVDTSPKAIKEFIDGPFAEGRPIFEELKNGVTGDMEARPERSKCKRCRWCELCPDSLGKTPPMIEGLPDEVGFGEM